MLYIDTSVLVSALTNETASEKMQEWLFQQSADGLAISEWAITEVSAAFSMKVKMGHIEAHHQAETIAAFNRLVALSFSVFPVSTIDFRTAARFADHSATGLRAADALHLAVASNQGAIMVTLDKHLAEAANALKVPVQLL
jgi:uncharacterized protein